MSPSALLCITTCRPCARSACTRCAPTSPVAPVTNTPSVMLQELRLASIELLDRLRVIVGTAEVEPVPIVRPDVNGVGFGVQRVHQTVDLEWGVRGPRPAER